MKGKSMSAKLSLIGAAVCLVTLTAFCIYAGIYFVPFCSVESFVEILTVDPSCDGDKAFRFQLLIQLANDLVGVRL